MTNPDPDPARRAALDHVLALVAADDCGDSLVLRGSMAMLAWFGDRAREPADIDWVVRPPAAVPLAEDDRYPYLDNLDAVRVWPEAVHGVARADMWAFEDFDTGGLRAYLPPEGLRWVLDEEMSPLDRPHLAVADLIRDHPRAAASGVVLDAERMREDGTWGYEYDGGSGGVRLCVPWRAPGDVEGEIQLDFAYDEVLPEPPILIAVPRVGVATPTVVWAATPRLSLAWKLKWLGADDPKQAKDLYDAVLLAERDGTGAPEPPAGIRTWTVDWPGDPGPWLDRLARALGSG
jgi:hypothetical protein